MKINTRILSLFFVLFGLFQAHSMAQATAGTYQILTLGTAGSHAQDPGSKGTMTVSSTGRISGSVYSYSDRSSANFTGSVNLTTGVGTINEGGNILNIRVTTSTRTWANISYTKRNSTSRGIVWGVR